MIRAGRIVLDFRVGVSLVRVLLEIGGMNVSLEAGFLEDTSCDAYR